MLWTKLEKTIAKSLRYGFLKKFFFLETGLPRDDVKEIIRENNFLRKNKSTFVPFFLETGLPRNDVKENMRENNFLRVRELSANFGKCQQISKWTNKEFWGNFCHDIFLKKIISIALVAIFSQVPQLFFTFPPCLHLKSLNINIPMISY